VGRREKGEGRREKGEGRREKGEGRREKGEGRREKQKREDMEKKNRKKYNNKIFFIVHKNTIKKITTKSFFRGKIS